MPGSGSTVPVPTWPSTDTVSGAAFHWVRPPAELVPLGESFTKAKLRVSAALMPRWMPVRVTI